MDVIGLYDNQKSPKNLNEDIFKIPNQETLIRKIINTQKLHIKKQVEKEPP